MPGLCEPLDRSYRPALRGRSARLYVARQWQRRNRVEERALVRRRAVSGLVLSSFRHDNPGPIRRNDWRA